LRDDPAKYLLWRENRYFLQTVEKQLGTLRGVESSRKTGLQKRFGDVSAP